MKRILESVRVKRAPARSLLPPGEGVGMRENTCRKSQSFPHPNPSPGGGGVIDRSFLKLITALLVTLALVGCASLEPWVKPYERELLADPLMNAGRDPISDGHLQHVRETRESARGASGSQGGGCGCN